MTISKLGKFFAKCPDDFNLWIGLPGMGPNGQMICIPAIDLRMRKDKKAIIAIARPMMQPAQKQSPLVLPSGQGKIQVVGR